jgi:HEAT repeat protein
MRRLFSARGRTYLLALTVLAALAAVLWWQRTPLLTWYYLRGLAAADEADRGEWVERVAGMDEAALPGLLDLLRRDDPRPCGNAGAALARLARTWGPQDPRFLALADQLPAHFANCSASGQQALLEVAAALLESAPARTPPAPAVVKTAERLLLAATPLADKGIRTRALALAVVLAPLTPASAGRDLCRDLARLGLKDGEADNRVRAVHLTLHPALRAEHDLLGQVVPLLHDAVPEVRRAALLAVGQVNDVISEDDLLPLLHDADAEVRRLCEVTLRSRGLPESHLKLGRLLTDAQPSVRLEVLHYLHQAADLDLAPGVWLRRLSHDASPAVRAAAVRACAEHPQVELSDRLLQMSQEDPSATVQQLAAYYLSRQQARKKDEEEP